MQLGCKCRTVTQLITAISASASVRAPRVRTYCFKEWPDIDQSLAQLNMRYIPMFRNILSSKGTALFYQLNRRVQLMIDVQLIAALPLIEP